jgi:hypothetical protein
LGKSHPGSGHTSGQFNLSTPRSQLCEPPWISAEDFLAQVERQGLKKFVAELRNISADILENYGRYFELFCSLWL